MRTPEGGAMADVALTPTLPGVGARLADRSSGSCGGRTSATSWPGVATKDTGAAEIAGFGPRPEMPTEPVSSTSIGAGGVDEGASCAAGTLAGGGSAMAAEILPGAGVNATGSPAGGEAGRKFETATVPGVAAREAPTGSGTAGAAAWAPSVPAGAGGMSTSATSRGWSGPLSPPGPIMCERRQAARPSVALAH